MFWWVDHGWVHCSTRQTRRCESVHLGVVIFRVWYFQHALLQLNNCHHIPPEKINPLFYFFAELHSFRQYVPIHNKNPVTSWQCFEKHIFNTDLLSAKLQHRTPVLTAWKVRFISVPLILTLWGRSTGIICLFIPIKLYSVFRLLTRAYKVPEVQYPQGFITE